VRQLEEGEELLLERIEDRGDDREDLAIVEDGGGNKRVEQLEEPCGGRRLAGPFFVVHRQAFDALSGHGPP
jgi:hypothetical protein